MNNKNILIADDDREILEFYKNIFNSKTRDSSFHSKNDDDYFRINTFQDGAYLLEYFFKTKLSSIKEKIFN